MANLKELRGRINSVSSTMQITNAMKMVSAAKLNRAQEAIDSMRPYANKLSELLESLMASLGEDEGGSEFAEQRETKRVLLVPISSNRGLAGPFNSNIVKRTKKVVRENYDDHQQIELFPIGKKANDVLEKSFGIHDVNTEIFDNLHYEEVEIIAERLMKLFRQGSYDEIHLVYNHFKNAATQVVLTEQFLPIKPVENDNSSEQLDYIFEPEKKGIIEEMIPKSLKMQLFKALRDSFASEHGARMTAMHSATENATELRDDLNLKYNKARQASITNEILEIVGGAEALAD